MTRTARSPACRSCCRCRTTGQSTPASCRPRSNVAVAVPADQPIIACASAALIRSACAVTFRSARAQCSRATIVERRVFRQGQRFVEDTLRTADRWRRSSSSARSSSSRARGSSARARSRRRASRRSRNTDSSRSGCDRRREAVVDRSGLGHQRADGLTGRGERGPEDHGTFFSTKPFTSCTETVGLD